MFSTTMFFEDAEVGSELKRSRAVCARAGLDTAGLSLLSGTHPPPLDTAGLGAGASNGSMVIWYMFQVSIVESIYQIKHKITTMFNLCRQETKKKKHGSYIIAPASVSLNHKQFLTLYSSAKLTNKLNESIIIQRVALYNCLKQNT